ncbi:T9SS type A sorting domain-containing protein [Panacibacter sp. DH6]|uniref:T9SS type A sorting domain-containing protein n=1 Tax=Panacibacter microcysteis TaxID=2793269 RepID=A0A931MD99_9BACT|nr:T9SS type A sorting domain-containing protein [Panacibacter microcysteis]MBG9378515.1 T9SS type A sorting domain-containing protein [Panacibacter microcysteis]
MKNVFLSVLCMLFTSGVFANLSQGNWRWRNDNASETAATWKAAEGVTFVLADTASFRLRMEIINSAGEPRNFTQSLQYATNPNGPWEQVNNVSSAFRLSTSSFVADGQSTTKQLSGYSANTFTAGEIISADPAFSQLLQDGTKTEYEWVLKATGNVIPNTTYYFKAGSLDDAVAIPFLTTAANIPVTPALLSNGGFEDNLADWKGLIAKGSATFEPATTNVHGGSKALKVVVTDKGGNNKIGIRHNSFAINTAGTYELRFWALADTRDALLNINFRTAAGNNLCAYKIYDRFDNAGNGWQMYHYTFRVTQSPVTFEMAFNSNTTYYIDDMEIIPATDDVIDVNTQYKWQYGFSGYGWLSGDNDNSVLLPDSSIAWIFSDSFMGTADAHSNIIDNTSIINNLVVHEKNGQFTSIYGGNAGAATSLFSPGNGNIFWNAGGVVDGNKLKVLLIEIGGGGTYQNRTYIGTLSLPGLQVQGQVVAPYTGPNSPNTIFQDGGYNYIYLSERAGTFENYSQVARVPAGKLNGSRQWEFYKNDGTWSTGYTNVKRIISGVEAGTVRKLGEGNYVMSGVPNLTNEVAVWFAPAPEGPWTNKHVVCNIPQEEGVLAYQGHIDAGSGANGLYTLSYSVYPFAGLIPQQQSDKGSYIPYYVKSDLKALSPYRNNAVRSVQAGASVTVPNNSYKALVVPNPAAQYIQFAVQQIKDGQLTATLTDMTGHVLHTEKIMVTANAQYRLHLQSMPPAGMYMLQLSTKEGTQTLKVVVQ